MTMTGTRTMIKSSEILKLRLYRQIQPWELGKMRQQFYFDFCLRKGHIQWHYDGKKFCQKFIISVSKSKR